MKIMPTKKESMLRIFIAASIRYIQYSTVMYKKQYGAAA